MAGERHPVAWEYAVASDPDEVGLNALGADGWELVAVTARGDATRAFLKRPALGFRERVTLEQRAAYLSRADLGGVGGPVPSDEELP